MVTELGKFTVSFGRSVTVSEGLVCYLSPSVCLTLQPFAAPSAPSSLTLQTSEAFQNDQSSRGPKFQCQTRISGVLGLVLRLALCARKKPLSTGYYI